MWLLLMPLLASAMNSLRNPDPLMPEEYRYSDIVGNNTYFHTFMVPMRDGVELETVVFTKKPDLLQSYTDPTFAPSPVVLERSPYNLMMTFSESVTFVTEYDYISVIQSFRGRHGS